MDSHALMCLFPFFKSFRYLAGKYGRKVVGRIKERWWGELKRGGGGVWGVEVSVEVIRWGRGGMEAVDDYHRVRDSLEVE